MAASVGGGTSRLIRPKEITQTGISQIKWPEEITDNGKRHIVTGIALHNVLIPELKKYVELKLEEHYQNLVKEFHVNDRHKFIKPPDERFSISSLERELNDASYSIKSHHELAKLYLERHMRKFSKITDESFDSSALLGVIIGASCFSKNEKEKASKIRSEVRNEWAHVNREKWTDSYFLKCFQIMEDFVNCLPQSKLKKNILNRTQINEKLNQVKENGLKLFDRTVDVDTINQIIKECEMLMKAVAAETEGVEEIRSLTGELNHSLRTLECSLKNLKEDHDHLKEDHLMVKNIQMQHSSRLDKLENITLQPEKYFYDIPHRNQYFTGRADVLKSVTEQLKSTKNTLVISGLGGVGKTSLALEICWDMKEDFPGGVYWLTADTRGGDNTLKSSLFSLASKFSQVDASTDETRLVDLVTSFLARQKKCLLIIDNLDNEELTPMVTKLVNGRWIADSCVSMIITTRVTQDMMMENLTSSQVKAYELTSLLLEEGVEFLQKRTELKFDKTDGEDIVLELGALPLALDQAAAYLKVTKGRFSSYLKRLRKEKLKLLDRKNARAPTEEVDKAQLAVSTTWSLNMMAIQEECPEAREVMNALAFLSPSGIAKNIINSGSPSLRNEKLAEVLGEEFDVIDIILVLTKLSLFDQTSDNMLSVHRLVQEVIKEKVEQDNCLLDTFENIVRMLMFAMEQEEVPMIYSHSSESKVPTLCGWALLVENIGHFIEQVKSFGKLSNEIFHCLEFSKLVDQASLYYYLINQTQRSNSYKQVYIQVISKIKIQNKSELPEEIPLPLSYAQKEALCMMLHDKNETSTYIQCDDEKIKQAENLKKEAARHIENKRYDFALLAYNSCLQLRSDKEFTQKIYLNLCHIFYRIEDYEKVELYARKVLEECPNSKALFYMAIQFWKQENLPENQRVKTPLQEEGVLGELGYAFAALSVYFSEDKSATNMLVKKQGINLFRTRVIEVKTPEELKKAIENASMNKIGRAANIGPGERQIIYIRSGEYVVDPEILALSFGNVVIGDVTNSSPKLIFHDRISPLIFRNMFFNIDFQMEGTQLSVQLMGEGAAVIFCKCKFQGNFAMDYGTNEENETLEDMKRINQYHTANIKASTSRSAKNYELTRKIHDQMITERNKSLNRPNAGPAISVERGKCILVNCEIRDCLGGGVLVSNPSKQMEVELYMKGSIIEKCGCAGVEAREGGNLRVEDCDINENGQGVLVWRNGQNAKISHSRIRNNKREGVIAVQEDENFENTLNVTLEGNIIHHNHIGVSTGFLKNLEIIGNQMYLNSTWGIIMKNTNIAVVAGNDIHRNYCGGIRVALNRFDNTLIKENMIHDHTGPHLVQTSLMSDAMQHRFLLSDTFTQENSKPVILMRNKIYNNELSYDNISELIITYDHICNYCQRQQAKYLCPDCRKVFYCNQVCREKGERFHQIFCKSFKEKYVFKLKLTHEQFAPHPTIKSFKGTKTKKELLKEEFLVKVQAGSEGTTLGVGGISSPIEDSKLLIYDKSRIVSGSVENARLFNLVRQFGKLGSQLNFSKKIFLFARILKKNIDFIEVNTDRLFHDQDW